MKTATATSILLPGAQQQYSIVVHCPDLYVDALPPGNTNYLLTYLLTDLLTIVSNYRICFTCLQF
jgi:hypothetical protein